MLLTVIGAILIFFGLAGTLANGLGYWSSSKRAKEGGETSVEWLVKASRRGAAATAFAIVALLGILLILLNLLNF